MKHLIFGLVFLFAWNISVLQAQDNVAYEIQLATFAAPSYKDFHKLYNTGYVYSVLQDNGLSKIYMGTYTNKNTALSKLKTIKKKGFKDAFLSKRVLEERDAVYVLQLATYDQQADIYWADWQRLTSHLAVQLSESKVRVCAGPYYTLEEAKSAQERILERGPKDIFLKKVSIKVLHKIGQFDLERSPSYGKQTGMVRNSVKALQRLLIQEKLYDAKENGAWTSSTQSAVIKFKKTNSHYVRHQAAVEGLDFEEEPAMYTLQYYINMLPDDPQRSVAGLLKFKHPMAKLFVAYAYLNEDVEVENKITNVNRLMNDGMGLVFKNYRGKTRYDFSMKYSYEELEQLLSHMKAMYEVVRARPDMPCWLFERHPDITKRVFAPYWNSSRDAYTVSSDCGSFMDSEEMRMLYLISKDFAATERPIESYATLNRYYVEPAPLTHQEMEENEKWNGMLWKNLKTWSDASPLQKNMYTLLRFSYYDALQKLEMHFMQKGFAGIEARSLGLKLIRETVGRNLKDYTASVDK
jgi:hypothetical protein